MSLAPEAFRAAMLHWYDLHRRDLPWRAPRGEKSDPYKIWLSEIMLQQTTVQAVKGYFEKFTNLWPTINDLAIAETTLVMDNWAGLGYYARARNLHKCARIISEKLSGRFPDSEAELLKLPGIGPYTSAAIMAIAFNQPANVVDGNVERVMARYFAIETPFPDGKPLAKNKAQGFIGAYEERHADYAQSLMDLGATICRPQSPLCSLCPLQRSCKAYQTGKAGDLPARLRKAPKPEKHGFVYICFKNEQVLLERRISKGLLGNTLGFPTGEWAEISIKLNQPEGKLLSNKKIRHVFTHFGLTLTPVVVNSEDFLPDLKGQSFWVSISQLSEQAFPSVFKKVYNIIRDTLEAA